jgi:hypothetical protein
MLFCDNGGPYFRTFPMARVITDYNCSTLWNERSNIHTFMHFLLSLLQGRSNTVSGFELDLSTPDAHKTAAIFGPSTTAVPAAACALLTAWLAEARLTTNATAKPYVFVLGSHARGAVDHAKPLGTPRWTEVVKAVLKRQAGVAFAPKDLRSSFITFLLSDANSDEALKKAVATAMRHSTAMQASGAYDKERAERTWASAVQVAGAYAARFE